MASILVHITHGPENPTRATLVFLAGDAVQLLRDACSTLVAKGARFYASGMSAKARGLADQDLAGNPAEYAMPNKLVQIALSHARMFTY